MATSFDQFMQTVKPGMLDTSGRFLGPQSGVNYAAEGMTPQQFYDFQNQMVGDPMARDGADAGQRQRGVADASWREGPIGTGDMWSVPLAMVAAPFAAGAMGLGAAEVGSGLGFSPTAAGFSPAADSLAASSAAGTAAGTGGFAGSLAMPELAGSMPAGVEGFASMGGTAGATAGELSPLAAQTIAPGASAVAPVTAGTAATGATGVTGAGAATAAAGSPFMDTLKGVLPGLAKGVIGGALNTALAPNPQTAINAADPFSTQRAQYQPQLQQMMQGQFSPTDPSYAWRFGQGMEAVNRGAAASGMLNSGNRLIALQQYGQGAASQEYQNQFNRLAQLSGANFGTGAAGSIAQQQAQQQQAGTNAVVGGVMDYAGKLYDSWNKSVGGTPSSVVPSTANFGGYEDLQF